MLPNEAPNDKHYLDQGDKMLHKESVARFMLCLKVYNTIYVLYLYINTNKQNVTTKVYWKLYKQSQI